jgi:hypothetical protein
MNYFNVPEEKANEWAPVLCMSPGITGRRGTKKSRTEDGEDICPGNLLGLALADGGISPYMGCDVKGPTTVLKSVAKAPHTRFEGMLLNQRMAPGHDERGGWV